MGVHPHHRRFVGYNQERGTRQEQLQLDTYHGSSVCVPRYLRDDDPGADVPGEHEREHPAGDQRTLAVCLYDRCAECVPG